MTAVAISIRKAVSAVALSAFILTGCSRSFPPYAIEVTARQLPQQFRPALAIGAITTVDGFVTFEASHFECSPSEDFHLTNVFLFHCFFGRGWRFERVAKPFVEVRSSPEIVNFLDAFADGPNELRSSEASVLFRANDYEGIGWVEYDFRPFVQFVWTQATCNESAEYLVRSRFVFSCRNGRAFFARLFRYPPSGY